MKQLSGLDSMFLAVESPRSPTHVSCVSVVDPVRPVTIDAVKEHLEPRLHILPPFRRRIVEPPLGIGRPYWIEDPDFDLDYHIHHVAVPAPGGDRELAELVAKIISRPLDRSRPLWQWWIIDGLADGQVANLWKVHHACIDGITGASLQELMFDHLPDAAPIPPKEEWTPDTVPSDVEVTLRAAADFAGIPRRTAKLVRSVVRTGGRVRELRPWFRSEDDDAIRPSMPIDAPKVSFNGPITGRRAWAFATTSLDDIKTVKDAFGVKVNDVVLAISAGAVRRYLIDRGELPDESLTASVPVSVRAHDDRSEGNVVSGMNVRLATDIDDPVERLQAIYASSQSSKVMHEALGADVIMSLADVPPPALLSLASGFMSWSNLSSRLPTMANLVVSNVPGPRAPLYFLGGEVQAFYSTGVIMDGVGLFIGLMSYRDQVDYGILGCADMVPDPWPIADALHEELAVLVAAAERETEPSKKQPKRPTNKAASKKSQAKKSQAKKSQAKKSQAKKSASA